MVNDNKQKRVRKILDSDQCPCPACSSQDPKKEIIDKIASILVDLVIDEQKQQLLQSNK